MYNVSSTAKVIWRRGHGLVSSDRLVKRGFEPATSGLQGKRFIHYATSAPSSRGGDRRRKWRRWVVEEEIGGRGGEKIGGEECLGGGDECLGGGDG